MISYNHQTYADYSSKKRAAVLKRVKKKYKPKNSDSDEDVSDFPEPAESGISLNDYIQIFAVLIHIDDVDKVSAHFKNSLFRAGFKLRSLGLNRPDVPAHVSVD